MAGSDRIVSSSFALNLPAHPRPQAEKKSLQRQLEEQRQEVRRLRAALDDERARSRRELDSQRNRFEQQIDDLRRQSVPSAGL